MVPNYILPADAAFSVYINRSDFTFAHVFFQRLYIKWNSKREEETKTWYNSQTFHRYVS